MPHFSRLLRLLREVGFPATGTHTIRLPKTVRSAAPHLTCCQTEVICRPPFSSQFSRTAITDLHHNRCDDSLDSVPSSSARVSRDVRIVCLKPLSRIFDNRMKRYPKASGGNTRGRTPKDRAKPQNHTTKSNLLNTLQVTSLLTST